MSALVPSLARIAALQSEVVDRLALTEAVSAAEESSPEPAKQLQAIAKRMHLPKVKRLTAPDPAALPALIHDAEGWRLLRGQNAMGQWVTERVDLEKQSWAEVVWEPDPAAKIFRMRLAKPFSASKSPIFHVIRDEVFSHWKTLGDIMLSTILINLIAIATSFYSMQVYDRVVPTGASQTLMVLTIGVFAAIIFELAAKYARSAAYERLVDLVDQHLTRAVYMRLLSIRLDQMPKSVESLAAQLRGYESVRAFLTTVASYLLVDAPFALFFILIIATIVGWIALIPLFMLVVSLGIGFYYRKRMDALASAANNASNLKNGLLVESIEGAETIKSGQGGWRMLSRWLSVTDDARQSELEIRHVSEHASYLAAALQQMCYIGIVATGALFVSTGHVTMGGLIACSILAGRALAPVAAIPAQLVQWSNVRAALQGLDRFWALKDDHDGEDHPVILPSIKGNYRFENVASNYGDRVAIQMEKLEIKAGEKIGVIGPIGSGKTTLLRLLSGMYKPHNGRILLDDVDLSHLSKPILADNIGYLQQEGRLFSGTLRENLVLGLMDPGDDVVMEAARATGLMSSVISSHPKGLQQPIFEGGIGLSGGQRQLVNLTRIFLRKPSIWLLDEPTASIDKASEEIVLQALRSSMRAEDTMILVTHKQEMLALVSRLMVINNNRVVIDGPRDAVLKHLQQMAQSQGQPTQERATA
ncbi:ATP-binding cassette domain-containing protein [Aureimonas fodinaquatilis]|uniref:ATP-binding cassette domain-containing protein n=1 Tax=Aureimonas fodinaquatilis TaxID=2565783 RepID=A0A5B0DPR3_9HYPH|nr:ATP-binding cassette domain-containing protein [Aureimonas fodinaquatilis]KAA0968438.1 ATP-binding cassette domain-containing protein [Aureimonas fodinaquatilis]